MPADYYPLVEAVSFAPFAFILAAGGGIVGELLAKRWGHPAIRGGLVGLLLPVVGSYLVIGPARGAWFPGPVSMAVILLFFAAPGYFSYALTWLPAWGRPDRGRRIAFLTILAAASLLSYGALFSGFILYLIP